MKSVIKEGLITLLFIIAGALAALFITRFLVQKVTVEGTSMVNTLEDDDLLFGVRKGLLYDSVDRYDIVVLDMGNDECYVKRVIGLPGETIQIKEDGVYIDGSFLNETYGYSDMGDPGIAAEEIELAEGEYFVLGDNRSISMDSRDPEVGIIEEEQIMSKLGLRFWPLNKIGVVE